MIGKTIRIQRLERGYSQSYMAFCLDISQNAYSKIELGHTEITVCRIIEIAAVLRVPVFTLLKPVIGNDLVEA